MIFNILKSKLMTKKIFFITVLLGFSALSYGQKKLKVVATASMIADMAANIAGDAADIQTIVPIGGDPHIYEPTPSDAKLVASADLILKNGLTFEGWLSELIENSGTKARAVTVTEGIEPIQSIKYKNATDPHAWMEAQNGIIYCENIAKALTELSPENAQMFAFNLEVYKKQLEETDRYIRAEIEKIPSQKRTLITSHDAFQYYGRRYGIRLESVLGTSTDADAQTSDIIRLNKVIAENDVPAIFIESTINPKLLEQIAKDNKIEIGGKLYSDSIGDKNSPAPTYIDMLRHNTDVIVKALSAENENTGTKSPASSNFNWLFYILLGALLLGAFVFLIKKMNLAG